MAACVPLQLLFLATTHAAITIDGQVAAVDSDCYERSAIGQRLPETLVRRTADLQLVRDCEKECDADGHKCNAFSFGVSSVGNGTCELAERVPPAGALLEHPDYDVYIKKTVCREPPPPTYPNTPPTQPPPRPRPHHQACFRLVGRGARPAARLVRSSLPLQTADACRDACAAEQRFVCETFAFRFDERGYGLGSCELSDVPADQLELVVDRAYDVFERDRSCSAAPGPALPPPPPAPPSSWADRNDGPVPLPPPHDCFIRARSGFRLDRPLVKAYYNVPTLHHCELQCLNENHFLCLTFSYRYSVEPRIPHGKCLLSDTDYRHLDPYTDIIPDRDYDIYHRDPYCTAPNLPIEPAQSDCFWRRGSGVRLDPAVVRESSSALSLGDCEWRCLRSRLFTCRTFTFRYGPPAIGTPLDNCLMTDWPFYELDPRRHLVNDLNYDIYERGSYGHGCEVNQPIPPVEEPQFPWRPPPMSSKDDRCYTPYGAPAQLLPSVVKKVLNVPTEADCKAECTLSRENFQFYCASLSFRAMPAVNAPPNCLLSDIEQRDLRPGIDFVHEDYSWLFAWNSLDPHCQPDKNFNKEPQYREKYFSHLNEINTWKYFTVSGHPCRAGTSCSLNPVGGFWFCEMEGGDAGAWDYCCRDGHQCGYSEGYNYPWCYVGNNGPSQWRPCSERYSPYPSHNSRQNYGTQHYWPVAYLHKEAPPNTTLDHSNHIQSQYEPAFHNYIENSRPIHSKKMDIFEYTEHGIRGGSLNKYKHTPATTHTDKPNTLSVLMKGILDKINSDNSTVSSFNSVPSFDVVVDKEDSVISVPALTEKGKNSNEKDKFRDFQEVTKLQPRYAHDTETDNSHNTGRLGRTWHWRTTVAKPQLYAFSSSNMNTTQNNQVMKQKQRFDNREANNDES